MSTHRKCRAPDCQNQPDKSRDLCNTHRSRLKRTGSFGNPLPNDPCETPDCRGTAGKASPLCAGCLAALAGACRAPDCATPAIPGKTLCTTHKSRLRVHGSFDLPEVAPRPACAADGCTRDAGRRSGLCNPHWQVNHRNGDTVPRGASPGDVRLQIEAAARATTDECVYLTDFRGERVPRTTVALPGTGRTVQSSRAVWFAANGDPGEPDVLHSCSGGSGADGCINIRHLYLGEQHRNSADMVRADRAHLAILTAADALVIYSSAESAAALAAEYGVSVATIYAVRNGHTWGAVTGASKKSGPRGRRELLTEDDIPAIRASEGTHASVAERYGVSVATIRAVRDGRSWKHVPTGPGDKPGNRKAKVTPGDVAAIRASAEPADALAERYGISVASINNARSGRTWSGVAGEGVSPPRPAPPKTKLTEAAVLHIFHSGDPVASLMAQYGVSQPTISSIRTGRTWKHVTSPQ